MQALGCLTTLIFGIVIAVIIAIINILRTVFSIKKKFSGSSSTKQSSSYGGFGRNTNEQTQNESKNQSNGHHKVFEDGEGDYVDFEELPK